MAGEVVVLDSGGANIKVGLASSQEPSLTFPNASAKVKGGRNSVIGDQILSCGDISALALRRPIDRGYVTNWELQRLIWDRAFQSVLPIHPKLCAGLVVTEPLFNLPSVQSAMDQVVFEEFQFRSCLPLSGPALSLRSLSVQHPGTPASQALCGLVVDAGFSFTHVAPVLNGQVLMEGVRRVNLGGKALTNYLKELVSFRSVNMMEETHLMEHIKEVSCFVSQDLAADLAAAKAGKHSCMYVLPDGILSGRGYLRPLLTKEQLREAAKEGKEVPALTMSNERFMVPELVFRPTDVGMEQAGLAEAVVEAANALHPELRPLLFSNVVCTGGTAKCPGFAQRLAAELRPLVPSEYQVKVVAPPEPSLSAWQGGAMLGRSEQYAWLAFSKSDYEERGSINMRARRVPERSALYA